MPGLYDDPDPRDFHVDPIMVDVNDSWLPEDFLLPPNDLVPPDPWDYDPDS